MKSCMDAVIVLSQNHGFQIGGVQMGGVFRQAGWQSIPRGVVRHSQVSTGGKRFQDRMVPRISTVAGASGRVIV